MPVHAMETRWLCGGADAETIVNLIVGGIFVLVHVELIVVVHVEIVLKRVTLVVLVPPIVTYSVIQGIAP